MKRLILAGRIGRSHTDPAFREARLEVEHQAGGAIIGARQIMGHNIFTIMNPATQRLCNRDLLDICFISAHDRGARTSTQEREQ